MKKHFLALLLFINSLAWAQSGSVGINTTTPNATFEVAGKPAITTAMDGIIAPRITGDQLFAKTYTSAQDGSIVYVTAAALPANQTGQTINVTQPAYYYFDGVNLKWVRFLNNNTKIPSYILSAEKAADDASATYNGGTSNYPMVFDQINLSSPQPAGYGWNWDGTNTSFKVFNPGIYAISSGVGVYNTNNTADQFYSIQTSAGTGFTVSDATPIDVFGTPSRFGNITYVALLIKDDIIKVTFAKSPSNTTAFGERKHSFISITYTPQ